MGPVLGINIDGRLPCSSGWQPAIGIATMAIHTSQVDCAIMHILDANMAIQAAGTLSGSLFGGLGPRCLRF